MVIATALNPYVPGRVRDSLLHHFDLGQEMNLATWWSTAGLLLLALLVYERFNWAAGFTQAERMAPAAIPAAHAAPDDGRARPGVGADRTIWLVLTSLYALLSLDELGSIHERVDDWGIFLIIGALVVIFHLYLLVQLGREPATRGLALGLVIGLMFMSSSLIQEFLEFSIEWPFWARGMRTAVEEGSELFGAFIILWHLVRYRPRQEHTSAVYLQVVLPNPVTLQGLTGVLFGGLLVHSLASLLMSPGLEIGLRGNPLVWYPSALFFILFCTAVWGNSALRAAAARWVWLSLSVLFLLDSVLVVYLMSPRQADSRVYALGWFSRIDLLFSFQAVLVMAAFWALYRLKALPIILGLAFLIPVLMLGAQVPGPATGYLLAGLFAFVVATLFLLQERQLDSLASAVSKG